MQEQLKDKFFEFKLLSDAKFASEYDAFVKVTQPEQDFPFSDEKPCIKKGTYSYFFELSVDRLKVDIDANIFLDKVKMISGVQDIYFESKQSPSKFVEYNSLGDHFYDPFFDTITINFCGSELNLGRLQDLIDEYFE